MDVYRQQQSSSSAIATPHHNSNNNELNGGIDDMGTSPPGSSFLTFKGGPNNSTFLQHHQHSNSNDSSGSSSNSITSYGPVGKTLVSGWYEAPLFDTGFISFLKSEEFSDITIIADGKQYHLHRVILAHSSKYLSDYFDIQQQEKSQQSQSQQQQQQKDSTTYLIRVDDNNNTYELKGQFVEYFDQVVGYMYDGKINLTQHNSLQILSLSSALHIKALKRECTFYLTRSINKENAFQMLHKAIHINSEDLITKCITVICKHFNQIIQPHFSAIFLNHHINNTNNNNNNNESSINTNGGGVDTLIPSLTRTTIGFNQDNTNGQQSTTTTTIDYNDEQQQSTILTTSSSSGSDTDQDDDDNINNNNSNNSSSSINIQPPQTLPLSINNTNNQGHHSSLSPTSYQHHSHHHHSHHQNITKSSGVVGSPSSSSSQSNSNDKSLNISTIHTIPELLSLSVPIMIRLMRQNNLSVSNEAIVYKTIVKYIHANRATLSESDIASLFEVVRFPLFNYQQLEEAQENTLIPKHLITEALLLRLKMHEGPKTPTTTTDGSLSGTSFTGTSTGGILSSLAAVSSSSPSSSILHNSTATMTTPSSSSSTTTTPSLEFDNQLMRKTPRAAYAISLEYKHDFDTCGVFYYIGTNGYKEEWSNPAMRGRVRVTSSSIEKGSVTECVGRTPSECWSMDVPASWIAINLGSSRTMVPTYYTLRHGGNSKADCLRNWTLQGSMDSKNWTVLSRHSNDGSLNGNFSTFTWPILNCTQAFRHFRLLQTGRNSSNHNFLSISGIEFYGDLYETRRDD